MGIGREIYPGRKAGVNDRAGSTQSTRRGTRASGLVGVVRLLLPRRDPAWGAPRRSVCRRLADSLRRLRRRRALSDTRLDLAGQVEQLARWAPGADHALEQVDGVLRGDAQRRERRRHTQGQRRVVGRMARQRHRSRRIRAPRAGTVTLLLRRARASSTPGAAGSGTPCSPSTTKAYWWCPWGSASVTAQTPPRPTRPSGEAF